MHVYHVLSNRLCNPMQLPLLQHLILILKKILSIFQEMLCRLSRVISARFIRTTVATLHHRETQVI